MCKKLERVTLKLNQKSTENNKIEKADSYFVITSDYASTNLYLQEEAFNDIDVSTHKGDTIKVALLLNKLANTSRAKAFGRSC